MGTKSTLILLAMFVLSGCGDQGDTTDDRNTALLENNQTIVSENNSSFQDELENNQTIVIENNSSIPDESEENQTVVIENNSSNPDEPAAEMDESLKVYYASALDKKDIVLKEALHAIIYKSVFLTYTEAYNAMDTTDMDVNNPGNVILFYKGVSEPADNKCHSSSMECWNREHLWPKSLGVGYDSGIACYTDLHHLRPSDARVNSDRSNKIFGLATTIYPEIEDFFWDDTTWEVADTLKGDVARAMFYMSVRYEGDGDEPDLEIYAHDESISNPAELCLMLEWNRSDPVSDFERRRNDSVYEYQENRNPFVDNPSWADDIWKAECTR